MDIYGLEDRKIKGSWIHRVVIREVAKEFHMSVKHLMYRSRRRYLVRARSAAMYICRKGGASYPALGDTFHMDHTTVMHLVKSVDEWMREDQTYASKVQAVLAQFTSGDTNAGCASAPADKLA